MYFYEKDGIFESKTVMMKNGILIISLMLFSISESRTQTWSVIGDTLGPNNNVCIYDVFVHNDDLYIAGTFWNIGNQSIQHIAKWDGQEWTATGSFDMYAGGVAHAIAMWGDKIVYGGEFRYAGDHVPGTAKIALWDGTQWLSTGINMDGYGTGNSVKVVKVKGQLYIAGSTLYIDSIPNNSPIRWDGTNWEVVGGGVSGWGWAPKRMEIYHDQLVVGGDFCYAGGQLAYAIALWDGQLWHDLDTGLNGSVRALTVDTINDFIYAGGFFKHAGGDGGTSVRFLARWNSESWERVGSENLENWKGVFENGVYSAVMYHRELYVGGPAGLDSNLFRLQGDSLVNVYGTHYVIFDMEVFHDTLIVAGTLGVGFNPVILRGLLGYYAPPPTDCAWLMPRVFADKYTTIIDSATIAFRNNNAYAQSWLWDFGDGESDTIKNPMHTYTDTGTYEVSVIVEMDGCIDTAFRTITITDTITAIKSNALPEKNWFLGQNQPNPHNGTTVIPFKVPPGSKAFLQINTTSGELADEYALNAEQTQITIYTRGFKAGIYFYC
ncbi:MAG: PKD domain-containing protein, partial [Bacteroidetes bacterium]|nr:PKD domain-containing protein [Bacteroidota bacterium]